MTVLSPTPAPAAAPVAALRSASGAPIVLGIESSCDETAVALVTSERVILAEAIASQEAEHAPYGGVVPEIAARAHAERLAPLLESVMARAGVTLDEIAAVAATAGPGLIGGVMVGLVTGKALAMAAGKPLLAINHLEGHALSPRLADPALGFPYLLLLVSGGHCQILSVEGVGRYRRLATTIDDALGEAFDKTAKILGLGYPGGPAVERLALGGDPRAVPLPRPLKGSAEPHFSFAGLKSAVLRAKDAQCSKSVRPELPPFVRQNLSSSVRPELPLSVRPELVGSEADPKGQRLHFSSPTAPASRKDSPSTSSGRTGDYGSGRTGRESSGRTADGGSGRTGGDNSAQTGKGSYSDADIAASFQQAAIECLIDRLERALGAAGPFPALVVAGGVAANRAVRAALETLAQQHGMAFTAPPLALCTDNAAMIAWAGCERLALAGVGFIGDPLDFAARPRWPLDPAAEAVRGAGVKA